MQKLIALMWKETVLRFSSPMEWLFFLILPLIFTVLLAGGTGAPDDNRARLLVVDQAQSPLSAQLLNTLDDSGSVRPDVMDLAQAEDEFDNRNAAALLVIPPELTSEAVQQGAVALDLRLLPNNTAALMAEQTVNAALQRVSAVLRTAASSVAEAERIRPFENDAARDAFYQDALQAAETQWSAAPQRFTVIQASTPDEIDYDPQTNSSVGQMITWVFIPLLGISGSFVYERQIGTLRRMLVTPTRKSLYLFATILANVLLALLQMTVLLVFGAYVMHIYWGSSPGALVAVIAAATLAAAGIGTALGAFVKTGGQANGIAILTGMVMALLGGCWYPIELFPKVVQDATRVLPTRWAMEGILNLALRGQGLENVLPHIGVLLAFALGGFAIGVWRFRYE
ncbi:MAG TPA: ABC transporter permease [Anaerolineaceae bacterium]